jgi:hypothetical protein
VGEATGIVGLDDGGLIVTVGVGLPVSVDVPLFVGPCVGVEEGCPLGAAEASVCST